MTRLDRPETRRKLSKLSKVLSLLRKKPMTSAEMAQAFRECRFDDYSFWISEELKGALRSLKKRGEIVATGRTVNGKPVYRLKGEGS